MKRGTIGHAKMVMFQEILNVERWGAVGLLESLWHFTANYSPQGNVGKWTNKQIAMGLHWKGDDEKLIAALISSGWLDEDRKHRLVVHDWAEHADQAVQRRLKRARLSFVKSSGKRKDRVYFAKREDGWIKIGTSQNVKRRIQDIETATGIPITL